MEGQKEALSRIYESHHVRGKRYNYLFCHGMRGAYLRDWIGQGKRVLDLGCRDGALTRFFSAGNQVVGADIDTRALQMAQENLGIETRWLDLNTEFPFADQEFDVVVACEILEHVFFLDAVLERICKTLKPGGLFIGSVPNAFRVRNRWKFLWGEEFDKDPTHVRLFSHQKVEAMLQKRFSDVAIVPIQGKVFPFLPVSAAMPRCIGRLFAKDLLWRATYQKR